VTLTCSSKRAKNLWTGPIPYLFRVGTSTTWGRQKNRKRVQALAGAGTPSRVRAPPELYQLLTIASLCWVAAAELIKIGYIATCDCRALGQPFNSWFFSSFQHMPYTFWWTYHGITWLAGPYSLLWWMLNSPAYFGYWPFFTYLIMVDSIVCVFLFARKPIYGLYYITLTVWFTTVDPVDFFPIVFAVAGAFSWKWLVLAPATKLPLGSELLLGNFSVYHWVFTSSNSFQGPENYGRYAILISVWLLSLASLLFGKIKGRKRVARRCGLLAGHVDSHCQTIHHL